MKTTKTNKQQTSILQAMETISSRIKEEHLSDDIYKKYKKEIKVISERLSLTDVQSVLLSMFVSRCSDYNILASEIGEDMDCSDIRMLMFQPDIDVLVSRKFVRRKSNDKLAFCVPDDVLMALKDDVCYVPRSMYCKTCGEFFCQLEVIFEMADNDELNEKAMLLEIETLLEANAHLNFVTKVKSYGFDENDQALLLCFCHLFVNNSDDEVRFHNYRYLYESKFDAIRTRDELQNGTHSLMTNGFVEYSFSDGFQNKEAFKLTEMRKREMLAELNLPSLSAESPKQDVIRQKNIVKKELFYPTKVEVQVTDLQQLLVQKNFRHIQQRMKKKGMRCGFACLFYGAPGTGKTETAMQLARMTGRDVMLIDIPKIRSCWVGETEKNIKGVFDRYRSLVKDSKLAPILLFNEADAIIGIRKEGAERSVDKMENTMQNIILQEMETLNGIMIATTNLTQNMDKAFERRFLYKIEFEKPDSEVRQKIWSSMLPDLSVSTTQVLAQQYPFSGGQIENVSRRFTIESILHGDPKDEVSSLRKYCECETIVRQDNKKIGFC